MPEGDPKVALKGLREEQTSVFLYAAIAATEKGRIAEMFERLRMASNRQAALWEKRLRADGIEVPPFSPSLRERLVMVLIRRLGPRKILPVLSAMKMRGLSVYRGDEPSGDLIGRRQPALHSGARAVKIGCRFRGRFRSNVIGQSHDDPIKRRSRPG